MTWFDVCLMSVTCLSFVSICFQNLQHPQRVCIPLVSATQLHALEWHLTARLERIERNTNVLKEAANDSSQP